MMRWSTAVLFVAAGCGEVAKRLPDAGTTDDARAARDAPDTSPRLVFVTGTTTSGAMGGLAGADALCMTRAARAQLPGRYLAWLATSQGSPTSRMTHHTGPYQLTTGVVIAQGWADLTDGNLASKIDRTESGSVSAGTFVCRGGEVWSNVDGAGNLRTGQGNCADWTSERPTGTGGNVANMDVMWTAGDCLQINCSTAMPIYCVQQ